MRTLSFQAAGLKCSFHPMTRPISSVKERNNKTVLKGGQMLYRLVELFQSNIDKLNLN